MCVYSCTYTRAHSYNVYFLMHMHKSTMFNYSFNYSFKKQTNTNTYTNYKSDHIQAEYTTITQSFINRFADWVVKQYTHTAKLSTIF